jgi:glycerol-3-phosphate cytidylyltransferase
MLGSFIEKLRWGASMPEGTTGYLFGVFDLFHIAHLDSIRLAAQSCERLVVAVATDDLVEQASGLRPLVPAIERTEILGAVRAITEVRILDSLDLPGAALLAGANLVFSPGDELDVIQLAALNNRLKPPSTWSGLRLVRLPAGRRTSSSQLRATLAGITARSSVA